MLILCYDSSSQIHICCVKQVFNPFIWHCLMVTDRCVDVCARQLISSYTIKIQEQLTQKCIRNYNKHTVDYEIYQILYLFNILGLR
jgi:hypothetical protein